MGSAETNKGENGARISVDSGAPQLTFTVYLMERFISETLHSERFDVKSRAHIGDLESRCDRATSDSAQIPGDVFVLEPMDLRGRQIELSATCSWGPCFAILRCEIKGCHMAVSVRPSPP